MESSHVWLSAAVAGFIVVVFSVRRSLQSAWRATPQFPPGPAGWPLIGTIDIAKDKAWVMFKQWGKTYSSGLIGVRVLGKRIIVLNTMEHAIELLDKRSAIYSDRPTSGLTMLTELCDFGWATTLIPYGKAWREERKIFHQEFQPSVVAKYRPGQLEETHKLLVRLVQAPEDFLSHLRLHIAANILRITYGIDVNDVHDPWITLIGRAMDVGRRTGAPGSFLVDIITPLKYVPEWFPGASFKRSARVWRKYGADARDRPFDHVQEQMTVEPEFTQDCVTKSLLEGISVSDHKDPAFAEYVARAVTGTIYIGAYYLCYWDVDARLTKACIAGSDTTYAGLVSFFLAMVRYPDVQMRAQAAIDVVCDGRLPDISDHDSLSYVHALVKETLRWNPVVPLNLVHRCTQNDIYQGYVIPEGTMLIANLWSMCNDDVTYPEPHQFVPERFLKKGGPDEPELVLNPDVRDPASLVFGFGRRMCPGQYMAYDSMWIVIASVLAVFDIVPTKDEDGNDVVPPVENEPGFISEPKPFQCLVKPRSSVHEALVRDMIQGVESSRSNEL